MDLEACVRVVRLRVNRHDVFKRASDTAHKHASIACFLWSFSFEDRAGSFGLRQRTEPWESLNYLSGSAPAESRSSDDDVLQKAVADARFHISVVIMTVVIVPAQSTGCNQCPSAIRNHWQSKTYHHLTEFEIKSNLVLFCISTLTSSSALTIQQVQKCVGKALWSGECFVENPVQCERGWNTSPVTLMVMQTTYPPLTINTLQLFMRHWWWRAKSSFSYFCLRKTQRGQEIESVPAESAESGHLFHGSPDNLAKSLPLLSSSILSW